MDEESSKVVQVALNVAGRYVRGLIIRANSDKAIRDEIRTTMDEIGLGPESEMRVWELFAAFLAFAQSIRAADPDVPIPRYLEEL
jgi:hypothetical protein